MDYLYEALTKPARLYVKQCPHCDLKYFGKTVKANIEKYFGSGVRWTRHLNKHGVEPIHLWNSDWYYDTSISRFALRFSRMNKIVEKDSWANLKEEDGLAGGHYGEVGSITHYKTINDPAWIETVGKQSNERRRQTFGNPEWKETTGNEKIDKYRKKVYSNEWKSTTGTLKSAKQKETVNNEEWKSTTGKIKYENHSRIISEIQNDPEWKETVGKEKSRKASASISKTINDPEWEKTTGKEKRLKSSKTQNDPAWKSKHFKTCDFCGKKEISPGNYNRWHGTNCKERSKHDEK